VEEEVNGFLVPSGSSTALSQAILRALRDREQLEQMGERGRARFEADHNWARTANETLELCRRLINEPRG
jgi:glycosyltransferase involved in cell wall biosynthesis